MLKPQSFPYTNAEPTQIAKIPRTRARHRPSHAMNKSLPLALALLVVAGCQPTRPPSPAAQKLIDEQTATGPVHTKIQARPFTYPVKAGEPSFWDIKVFDRKDKENGLRQEWKHFAQLKQQPGTKINNTQVLMNGWIISRDGTVFLPQKPTYKAYGSFYTDWLIPRPGEYTLWLEYQPSVAHEEELSMQELVNRKASYNLPREFAHWDFKAVGEALKGAPLQAKAPVWNPSSTPSTPLPTYNSKGVQVGIPVLVKPVEARVGQAVKLDWVVKGDPIGRPEIVAIAPDKSTLLHGIGTAPTMTFTVPGEWKIWFNYTRGEQSFAAPYSLRVAP